MTTTTATSPAPDSPPAETKVRRRRRWPWIVAASLIVLVLGLRVALPTIVERGAAYGSRYWLGLPVRIENVDLSLFGGRVLLEGISIGARPDDVTPGAAAMEPPPIDPATALFHLDRISTQLSWSALTDSTVELAELILEKPSVRVERESDGSIDPLRHARPLAPPSEEEETTEPSAPWKILVTRFALANPDVRVVDPPSGENLLEFGLEDFSLDDVAVDGSKLGLGSLGIRGPKLRVRRDLVISDAPAAPAKAEETKAATAKAGDSKADPAAPQPEGGDKSAEAKPAPKAPATAEPGYSMDSLHIERAVLTWITDNGPVDVALALDASNITADQGKSFPLNLQLEIQAGKISLQGEVGILPPTYIGTLSWSGLPFPPLLLASVPQLAPWLRAANSSAEIALDGDFAGAKGPPRMRLAGNVRVDAVAVADPAGQELSIGWKELEIAIRDSNVPIPEEGKPARTTIVALDRLRLLEPTISYTRPSPALDKLLGLDVAVTPPGAAKDAAATPSKVAPAKASASKSAGAADKPVVVATTDKTTSTPVETGPAPLQLSISSLELAGGDVQAFDKTLDPPGQTRVRNLSLVATNVRYPETSAEKITLRAMLPESAQLAVDGSLQPGNVGDFTVELKELDLPAFGPFAKPYGAMLDSGQFSTKTKVKLRGARVEASNELLLHKLAVSLRDPQTFEKSMGVPIDLALALLRDPAGNIRLTIPVNVDEKGTEIPMGAIIASAIRQALIGAVTSPLKMVGAVFSGGSNKDAAAGAGAAVAGASAFAFDPIPVAAGSAEIGGDQKGRIDGMVQLLAERPSIGLELRGRIGPEDTPAVAQQILIELHQAEKDLPEVKDSGFLARRRIGQALDKRAKGKDPELSPEDQALYERYIAAVDVPQARLQALAKSRAERVRAMLLEKGVAPARVSVGEPEKPEKAGVVIGFKAG